MEMREQRKGVEEHWNDKQQQGEGKKRELCIGKALNSYGKARRGLERLWQSQEEPCKGIALIHRAKKTK